MSDGGIYPSWTCLLTQPRHEQYAFDSLIEAGIEAYLPRYTKIIKHARKCRTEVRPLFTRYIFARAVDDPIRIQSAYRLRGISGFVGKTFYNSVVREDVINLIRSRETDEGLVELNIAKFTAGQKLKLINGPLAEFEAIFQEPNDKKRSWVLVELLGKIHRLKIDNHNLMAIH